MIEYSINYIRKKGFSVDNKVIMTGYSAGSKFANLFTALHPEIVKSIIAGGTGGLTIIPLSELNGWTLDFPLGVNDLKNFDINTFKEINQFYFIGADDYNDVALPKSEVSILGYDDDNKPIYERDECGNILPKKDESGNIIYILDKYGNYLPQYPGGYYSKYQINAANKGISDDVQERFDIVKEIYYENGVNSIFKKYPGNHITVFDNENLYTDIFDFYKNLNKVKEKK